MGRTDLREPTPGPAGGHRHVAGVAVRSSTGFDEYRRLDLYYVDNWSLLHDIRIVAKTFLVVVLQRGAS